VVYPRVIEISRAGGVYPGPREDAPETVPQTRGLSAVGYTRPKIVAGEIDAAAEPSLSDAEPAADDAPFPGVSYKAGARALPSPLTVERGMQGLEESVAAEAFRSTERSGQSFMATGRPTIRSVSEPWRSCALRSAAVPSR
jgi:hypothetical protein